MNQIYSSFSFPYEFIEKISKTHYFWNTNPSHSPLSLLKI